MVYVDGKDGVFTGTPGGYGRNANLNRRIVFETMAAQKPKGFGRPQAAPQVTVRYTEQSPGQQGFYEDAFGYAEQTIGRLDTDNSKTLDFTEFSAPEREKHEAAFKRLQNSGLPIPPEQLEMARQMMEGALQGAKNDFALLDRNKDKQLDAVEIATDNTLLADDPSTVLQQVLTAKIQANPGANDLTTWVSVLNKLKAHPTQLDGLVESKNIGLVHAFLNGRLLPQTPNQGGQGPNSLEGLLGMLGPLLGGLLGGNMPQGPGPNLDDLDKKKPPTGGNTPPTDDELDALDQINPNDLDGLDEINPEDLDNLDKPGQDGKGSIDTDGSGNMLEDLLGKLGGGGLPGLPGGFPNLPGMPSMPGSGGASSDPRKAECVKLVGQALDTLIADHDLRDRYEAFKIAK